jgi:hypothetical protein
MTLSATPKSYTTILQVGFNTTTDLLNYTEPQSTTAVAEAQSVIITLANTQNQAFNLATIFPGITNMTLLLLKDISNPGLAHTFKLVSAGANTIPIRAGGVLVVTTSGTPPTIYLDNSSASQAGNLVVAVVGS